MANIPGIAERGVLGLGSRIPRALALGEVFGRLNPWDEAKLMASTGNLVDPLPMFDTNSGTHVGFEFLNPRSGRIELRDRDGVFLGSYPRTEKPNIRDKLLGTQLFAIAAATYYKYFNSPPQPAPPQTEDNFVERIQELKQKGILPDVEVGEEEDPRAFGEPEEFTGPILQLEQLLGSSLPPLQIAPPLQIVPPSVATKESIINKLVQPETGSNMPPSSVGPDGPITDVPVGVPLDPKTPLVNPAMRAAALNNINSKKKVDKQNQAFTRFDSLQTRTSTQRIHNMETPLYDYSQQSSRINGLQPGNRSVII